MCVGLFTTVRVEKTKSTSHAIIYIKTVWTMCFLCVVAFCSQKVSELNLRRIFSPLYVLSNSNRIYICQTTALSLKMLQNSDHMAPTASFIHPATHPTIQASRPPIHPGQQPTHPSMPATHPSAQPLTLPPPKWSLTQPPPKWSLNGPNYARKRKLKTLHVGEPTKVCFFN